jgi:small subunit ribosomal protein S35
MSAPKEKQGRRETEEKDKEDPEEDQRVFQDYGEVYAELMRSETTTEAEKAEAQKAMETWEQLPIEDKNMIIGDLKDVREGFHPLRRTMAPIKGTFWNDEESDSEMVTNEFGEDDFEEDDITAMGHAKLEEHREHREYARIAVWEMPLLSSELGCLRPRQVEN